MHLLCYHFVVVRLDMNSFHLGYTRVPTEERPRLIYRHNPPRPGSGTWVPVNEANDFGDHIPEPLGTPRYVKKGFSSLQYI